MKIDIRFMLLLLVCGLVISCVDTSSSSVSDTQPQADGDYIGAEDDSVPWINGGDDDLENSIVCEPGLPCLGYPKAINFGAVKYGQSGEKPLALSNPGDIPVKVYGYELCNGAVCPAFSVNPIEDPSAEQPLVLEPGDTVVWNLSFVRLDASDSQATLRIRSNHLDGREDVKILLISGEKGEAVFAIDPDSIVFDDTSVQMENWKDFSIINEPASPESTKTVQILSIETESPFYLDSSDQDCYSPLESGHQFLASGELRSCPIYFKPGLGTRFNGELIVTIVGEDEPYTVPLSGRGIQPFMSLSVGSFCGNNSFGHVTVGFSKTESFSVINGSSTEETLRVEAVSLNPSEGPFSIRYSLFDQNSEEQGLNEPEVDIEKDNRWSFEIVFTPTEVGDFTQTLQIETNAQDFVNGIAEVELCGKGVGVADSVIGLVLAIPAMGTDRQPDEESDVFATDEPVMPVAYAPVWVKGENYVTNTDSLGRFTLGIPPENRPAAIWLVVDGTQAGNGYSFSTKDQYIELNPNEAVETVIVLGHYDTGNSQPAAVTDNGGIDWPMDGTATNLDDDMKDVLLKYHPTWIEPPSNGEREVSIRRASEWEFQIPLEEEFDKTPDPYHIYRFLPLGLSFGIHQAKLRLPNTSGLDVGTEIGFYMLSGDPPEWTRVADMRVVAEPLPDDPEHTVIITPEEGGRGITQFGRESGSGSAFDSIGFLGRGKREERFFIRGTVRDDDENLSNAPIQFIGPGVWDTQKTDADGRFMFSLRGVPGQRVLVGSYRDTPYDGTWHSVSAMLPVDGYTINNMVVLMPPEYQTGQLQGTITYDTGEPVGSGGVVTVKWIHPYNKDENPDNNDLDLNVLLQPAYTTEIGTFLMGNIRVTPESEVEVFITEPRHHVRSGIKTVPIQTNTTSTLDFVVSATDNVPPYIRNAYPYDGAYDLPVNARMQLTFSEPLDEETLNSRAGDPNQSIFLLDMNEDDVPIDHFFDESGNWLVIYPKESRRDMSEIGSLEEGKLYTLQLSTSITDPYGEPRGNPLLPYRDDLPEGIAFEATFRTVPPDCGPCMCYDWDTEDCVIIPEMEGEACPREDETCNSGYCRSGVCEKECESGECCDGCRYLSVGFPCGDQSGSDCDYPDTCDGFGQCMINYAEEYSSCGNANETECAYGDRCSRDGVCVHAYKSAGSPCGDAWSSVCDRADTCDGYGTCLSNYEPFNKVCRSATSECDVKEYCNGFGDCPTDEFRETGTSCGTNGLCWGQGYCCSHQCSVGGERSCTQFYPGRYRQCGNGDEDPCREWIMEPVSCSSGYYCENGQCSLAACGTGYISCGDGRYCAANSECLGDGSCRCRDGYSAFHCDGSMCTGDNPCSWSEWQCLQMR